MTEYLLKRIESEGSHAILPYLMNAKTTKMLLSNTTQLHSAPERTEAEEQAHQSIPIQKKALKSTVT